MAYSLFSRNRRKTSGKTLKPSWTRMKDVFFSSGIDCFFRSRPALSYYFCFGGCFSIRPEKTSILLRRTLLPSLHLKASLRTTVQQGRALRAPHTLIDPERSHCPRALSTLNRQ